jgi:hypothetical protein
MSRGGRPSARGVHKRDLIGPHEILEQLETMGGVPEDVVEEMKRNPRPRNPRVEAANEEVVAAVQAASDQLASKGIEHTVGELSASPDMTSGVAWIMSVTNAMKESVPRGKWCRHMRAADPHLGEIRTMAVLSAGIWKCVECVREMGPKALAANPWPDECDLCGTTMQPGHFNEIAFNIPGCFVNCTVCDACADFMRTRAAA